ncbi:hypothetical protein B0J17DRAFT_294185 [Rhizoctonia solani]|nr:hypothetical protein B0J17DRAFT_294185 [Rhizoctonia solani]
MFWLPLLEYNLTHPHPRNRIFLLATTFLFLLVLLALVLLNLVTLGLELVPSIQTNYQSNHTFLDDWWGTRHLPRVLRRKSPPCQPRDIGRGDTLRLSASLFDYTVVNTWNTSEGTGASGVPEQKRVEYRGESFDNCYVNSALYEYSMVHQTHSLEVGVECPGSPDYPIYVSMRTKMTFAWILERDFVAQYAGSVEGAFNFTQTANSFDCRNLVIQTLQTISTDMIVIVSRQHLSNPILGVAMAFYLDPVTDQLETYDFLLMYGNMTRPDTFPEEVRMYEPSFTNLARAVIDAVNLDLGDQRLPNIYTNATRLREAISPNLPPNGISSADWAEGSQRGIYGNITPPYRTGAEMLLHGLPIQLGNPTGLPDKSVMATSYLCPVYRIRPISSLLASVFVGSSTMMLSVWGLWMFLTTLVAKRIEKPRVHCDCSGCEKRKSKEENKRKRKTDVECKRKGEKEEHGIYGEENRVKTRMLTKATILRGFVRRTKRTKRSPGSRDEEKGNYGPPKTDGTQSGWPTALLDVEHSPYISGSTTDV